ncbi:MAG: sigma 54-interacting transcriptional regulator, partial [Candidatus Cloacimonadota bacterium]|nr:sigma 54-interacting transcriptional regulator [Candidatus Cloacimonadota bacterium]
MGNLESKLLELKKAGKFDKFRIYVEIFEICFQQRNREIFVYFDKFIKAWREYLEFDDTPDNNLKEHFGDAFKSLFSFIRKSNDTDNFKKYFLVYKEFEKFIENDTAKIGIFNSFGYLFCFQQNFESAIKFSELSLKLINKTDDVLSFPSRYLNLGSIYEDKGDFNTAKKYYLQGLDYANRNNYQHAMHLALSALGRLKMSVREYEEAIEYLLKALELIDDDPKNDNRIIMIGNLAGCYTSLNNHKKSLEYYNLMPIEWLRDNKTEFYFPILINMAISELSLKNYPEAEKKLLIAAEYADNNNNLTILLPSLINLGILYRETKEYKKAISYFLNAIKIAEKKDNKHQIGDCYENIATAYKNDKQFKQAIEYYKKSYKLSTAQNQSTRVLVVLKALSECYSSIDQSSKAYKTLKKYVEIKDKYEEDLKKKGNKKSKDSTYEAGRSKQYKFSEGLSLISREMSNKIGEQIIGNSTAMDRVIQETFLTSRSSDASILLLGESGTGKDLIAKLIHFASIRHKGPFVAVNSAVFSAGLVQSALFGHRKGAFTGASYDHIGYFEEAHNGTIFLDEISEMPAGIQANLLRILEN